jgi:ABC-2 type transport system ATP-binding protein
MDASLPYAIDVHNLTKCFDGKAVVDHITIQVPHGKIYGFMGSNGSGKTTTMRMLCGLLTPDEGEGTCLGFHITRESAEIKKRIGYMTQRFSFWEDLTVRENLRFVATMYEVPDPEAAIALALETLHFADNADKLAGQLSGGWKQRLALAACTMHKPQLLLLDEPTAGVDPKARRDFWDEIHRLADEGLTVLVSTHYMDEAERCHAIIYMSKGKLLTQGTVPEIIEGAHLITCVVRGKHLMKLMKKLEQEPAVLTVAPFGDSLHVSGTDEAALAQAIAPYRNDPALNWHQDQPSFEDVFIRYTS